MAAAPGFRIEQVPEPDGGLVLRLEGEVDLATVPLISAAVDAGMAGGCTRLVFDLTGVTFMDSSGLQVLVSTRNALDGTGGEMVISALHPDLRRVFELSGLADAFTIDR